MRRHFQDRVAAANQGWAVVPLEISFRASAPLLRAVDAVCSCDDAAAGVTLDGERDPPCRGARGATRGSSNCGRRSPPTRSPKRQPRSPASTARAASPSRAAGWPAPSPPRSRIGCGAASGWSRAAGHCAPATSWCWCAGATPLSPIWCGRVKQRGVPVAGADRLALAEELAVQDLVALGQFLLLPEDDLTLGTVLKGPLFGITEDELFLLAYDRGKERLWTRLRRLADRAPAPARGA